jgi:hypothetical protein
MQIDPEAQRYAMLGALDEDKEREIAEKVKTGEIPVVAMSNEQAKLDQIAASLREMGYKED